MDGDLISRKALLTALVEAYESVLEPEEPKQGMELAIEIVREAPVADAKPVKYGRIVEDWKDRKKGKIKRVFTCCNTDFTDLTQWMRPRYCPDCGAKIEGETERKWLSQES